MFVVPNRQSSTMRPTRRLSLALLLALPALAQANCYSMYDSQNHLSFQSTVAPVDLSARISDTMATRFPGRHLVISPDMTDCREVRASSEPTRPRARRPGQASPLLSNVPGAGDTEIETEQATPTTRRARQRR
jgi:hypothetical protein